MKFFSLARPHAFAGLLAVTLIGAALPAAAAHAAGAPKATDVVVLHDGALPAAVAAAHGVLIDEKYSEVFDGFVATITATQANALRRDPNVASVTGERTFAATHVPQITPRMIRRVAGNLSSTVSGDGTGTVDVNVAVLDSGVDSSSDDLNVAGGYNCFKPLHPSTKAGNDPNGHGTFVAGILAARDNDIDIVGVAPGARIWGVRVLNKNLFGRTPQILCGLEWAIATRADADPANDIDVINMSLGGAGSDDGACGTINHDPIHQAVCSATAAGIVVVAAAGNDAGPIEPFVPAAYSEVLTAAGIQDTDGQPGALGPSSIDPGGCDSNIGDDVPASFSNYGTTAALEAHLVAAPSTCISSLLPKNQVGVWLGTSFASPNVAGVVALCIAHGDCAGLSPAQIVSKIVADTAAYNAANPGYGFQGDPQHPIAGKAYGDLVRAALY